MGDLSRSANRSSVFISYSREDLTFAEQLAAALALQQFAITIDRHGISGGEDWKQRLGHLIRDADTIVFVLSPASANSEICRWEVDEAVRLGKRILPVVSESIEGIVAPPKLANLNYILFYADEDSPGSGFGTGLVQLVDALNTDLAWLREHTRLLRRAIEWDIVGRPGVRLLSGADIESAKTWIATRPTDSPEPTDLHLNYVKASETAEVERVDNARQQLEERERLLRAAELAQKEKEDAVQAFVRRTRVGSILLLVGIVSAGLFVDWRNRENEIKRFNSRLELLVYTISAQQINGPEPVEPRDLGEALFKHTDSGWYWQIQPVEQGTGRRYASGSLGAKILPSPYARSIPSDKLDFRFLDWTGPRGQPLRLVERIKSIGNPTTGARYSLIVAGPLDWPRHRMNNFSRDLAITLSLLAAVALAFTFYLGTGFDRIKRTWSNFRRGEPEQATWHRSHLDY
ncbi:MAG: toll/interleukin-1 receptor domain-containing protein [Hyphomicrobiaceae bacterium]